MSRECTLRLGWATPAKEKRANTQDFPRDLGTNYILFNSQPGALKSLPAPTSSLPRSLGKGGEMRLA